MTARSGYSVREAAEADTHLLAAFSCCSHRPRNYQVEVESYIRSNLWDWVNAPEAQHDDPRLLLVVAENGDLIAVGAHEIKRHHELTGSPRVRWIELVAVATPYQGKRSPDGNRYSDIMLSAVLTDIDNRRRDDIGVRGRVHYDNLPSLRLLNRFGFKHFTDVAGTAYIDVS